MHLATLFDISFRSLSFRFSSKDNNLLANDVGFTTMGTNTKINSGEYLKVF
jgi:hypothetical protein